MTEVKLKAKNIDLSVTKNGYIVSYTANYPKIPETCWVFESLEGVISWIGDNLKLPEEFEL